ncbi:acetate--CoA ligase family protein [Novosphingobium mathurense]|nr:acetate--CoA ligase family protein [Novosphingobium mathurense]
MRRFWPFRSRRSSMGCWWRPWPRADLEVLAHTLEALSAIVRGSPALREIDLNPVLVLPEGEGVVALDALNSG